MVRELTGVETARFYTIGEACAMLAIHRNTLRRYTRQNKIRMVVREADGKVLYQGRELYRLVLTMI